VNTAIAIGQGAGVALACGITAAVPLAVAAVVALVIGLPGDRSQLDDGWLVAVACALAVVLAAVETRLPARAQIALRAILGGITFELVAGDKLPWAGLVAGAVLAGLVAISATRMLGAAARAGSAVAAALLGAGAALGWAVLGLIPFVGYVLLVIALVLVWRSRGQGDQKYAGLRVLR
jgi:predicted phage tail protein